MDKKNLISTMNIIQRRQRLFHNKVGFIPQQLVLYLHQIIQILLILRV